MTNHFLNATGFRQLLRSLKVDKGDPGELFLLEIEEDSESYWRFNPEATLLDGTGQPTGKTVRMDYMPLFGLNPTGWDKLKKLTHEESLDLVAKHEADGLPILRSLTFWEYRKLFPDGLSHEEYKASKRWRFEYNGTEWLPMEMMDNIGDLENGLEDGNE